MNVTAVYDELDSKTETWANAFRNLCKKEYNYDITVLSMIDYRTVPRSVMFLYCDHKPKLIKFVEKYGKDRLVYTGLEETTASLAILGDVADHKDDVYRLEDEDTVAIIGIAAPDFEEQERNFDVDISLFIVDSCLLDKNSDIHKKIVRCCLHVGVTPNFELRNDGYSSLKVYTYPEGKRHNVFN